MTALDSSVLIAFLQSTAFPERDSVRSLIADEKAILPPATVTELLSDPKGGGALPTVLADIPMLPLTDGYWARAGLLRAKVRSTGRKAALGDALIAQACLDSNVPLLTRDNDFRTFAEIAGLRLA